MYVIHLLVVLMLFAKKLIVNQCALVFLII